jgi:hypothetical protein
MLFTKLFGVWQVIQDVLCVGLEKSFHTFFGSSFLSGLFGVVMILSGLSLEDFSPFGHFEFFDY